MDEAAETDEPAMDGRVVVVTGGAQGIGLAVSDHFAIRGARVCIGDIGFSTTPGYDTSPVSEQPNERWRLDVADDESVRGFFAAVVERFGRLDALVNAAGVGQVLMPLVDLEDAEWQRVIDVDLTGTFRCSRAAGRIMRKQKSGVIVNIASINGKTPAPLAGAYNAAKSGVMSLTRTMALELAPYGVRVNVVCPGPVDTALNQPIVRARAESLGISFEEMRDRIRNSIPLGRWGLPDDVASAVAFLCSPSADWITGESLTVSGGLEAVPASPTANPSRQARA
jgi:NAD(P)-dependent dehydrogenase (short-subunit alcohol dehydrogenase family)